MQLRDDVEIVEARDGATVFDRATGLQLAVSLEIAQLLTRLRAEPAHNHNAARDEPVAAGLVALFAKLGFTADTRLEDAREQQARYILADASYSELPRVRETVARARATTALHRDHLRGAALDDASWQLSDLPILTKEALRRHFPRGLTVDELPLGPALRRGDLIVSSTSGSTGERLQVYSDTRVERIPETVLRLWNMFAEDRRRPLRTAVLTSPTCSGGVCTRRNASFEERLSFEHTLFLESVPDPFDLTHQQLATMLTDLARFEPDLLLVNPVQLALLTRGLERAGMPLPTLPTIVCTYQTLSVCQQRQFARAYRAPVQQVYSATELAGSQVGVTCSRGALHVRLDHVFVEIVRAGVPVEPGELGHPVVTTHHPSMPLVRYMLSDMARFSLRPCGCEVGSAWPTLELEGRARDAIAQPAARDGLVTAHAVDRCLRDLPLLLYQVVETRPSRFDVSVIAEDGATLSLPEVRDRLAALLAPDALAVRAVSRLPFEESGKFRFVVPYVLPFDVGSEHA
jgi:phenylacetate-CoA ligase